MQKRSWLGAIMMSGIAVMSSMFTFLSVEWLRLRFDMTKWTGVQLAAVIFMIVCAILAGAFTIRNWSDIHFGKQAAIRWTVAGIILGFLLAQLRILLPPLEHPAEYTATYRTNRFFLRVIAEWILVYISYFLAFKFPSRAAAGCDRTSSKPGKEL
jgi:H+/Cl- antiporter ClcA